jgi:hypothetical protein
MVDFDPCWIYILESTPSLYLLVQVENKNFMEPMKKLSMHSGVVGACFLADKREKTSPARLPPTPFGEQFLFFLVFLHVAT